MLSLFNLSMRTVVNHIMMEENPAEIFDILLENWQSHPPPPILSSIKRATTAKFDSPTSLNASLRT